MEVPYQSISAGALQGLIESFVLREGTDYGEQERSFDEKVSAVRRQLERGEATIVFDEESESCSIVSKREAVSFASESKSEPESEW